MDTTDGGEQKQRKQETTNASSVHKAEDTGWNEWTERKSSERLQGPAK